MSQDKDQLIENVKTWLTIDNDIKKLQKAVKNKRKEKKELTENLVNIMNQRDIDCMNTAQGQLIKTTKKTKAPLSKKHLVNSIQTYFKDDGEKVQELCNYILNSRNIKVTENIRRKMPKS
jgi:hypothetical protein|tara:strand:- start:1659 stop:2018 length:360 start_codon:yes stop_codon:yes gene_type:complete